MQIRIFVTRRARAAAEQELRILEVRFKVCTLNLISLTFDLKSQGLKGQHLLCIHIGNKFREFGGQGSVIRCQRNYNVP